MGQAARALLSGSEGRPEQAGGNPKRWAAARAPSCEPGHVPGTSRGTSRGTSQAPSARAAALSLEKAGEHPERLRRGRRAGCVAWQRHRVEQGRAALGVHEQPPHATLSRETRGRETRGPQPLLWQALGRLQALRRRGTPPTHAADIPCRRAADPGRQRRGRGRSRGGRQGRRLRRDESSWQGRRLDLELSVGAEDPPAAHEAPQSPIDGSHQRRRRSRSGPWPRSWPPQRAAAPPRTPCSSCSQ